ncbi:proteasome subunit beta type-5 [Prunus yedoensis var. nudiflora]|uniref:Proteasome subunit beta type-5 n=1 Tax=Prunus yedoensis var. nudiflora TaxID=2094558 RepID=A0A314ZDX0_PRUYE|nr:proteasome subunit beta type-5 [Prunus yedoensis var. nudiflora]
MKLDTSGLESAAPLVGASSGFLDGFADAPSFEVPTTNDFDGFQKEAIQMVKPAKGTTTLAFIFKEVSWLPLILELAWEDIYPHNL